MMAAFWCHIGAKAHSHPCNQAGLWCRASVLVLLRDREQADQAFRLAAMLFSVKGREKQTIRPGVNGATRRRIVDELKPRGNRG